MAKENGSRKVLLVASLVVLTLGFSSLPGTLGKFTVGPEDIQAPRVMYLDSEPGHTDNVRTPLGDVRTTATLSASRRSSEETARYCEWYCNYYGCWWYCF